MHFWANFWIEDFDMLTIRFAGRYHQLVEHYEPYILELIYSLLNQSQKVLKMLTCYFLDFFFYVKRSLSLIFILHNIILLNLASMWNLFFVSCKSTNRSTKGLLIWRNVKFNILFLFLLISILGSKLFLGGEYFLCGQFK